MRLVLLSPSYDVTLIPKLLDGPAASPPNPPTAAPLPLWLWLFVPCCSKLMTKWTGQTIAAIGKHVHVLAEFEKSLGSSWRLGLEQSEWKPYEGSLTAPFIRPTDPQTSCKDPGLSTCRPYGCYTPPWFCCLPLPPLLFCCWPSPAMCPLFELAFGNTYFFQLGW